MANVLRVVPTYGARFWLFAVCDETLAFVPQTDTRQGRAYVDIAFVAVLYCRDTGTVVSALHLRAVSFLKSQTYPGARALNILQNRSRPQSGSRRRFISGGMAGVGALLLTHPLDELG